MNERADRQSITFFWLVFVFKCFFFCLDLFILFSVCFFYLFFLLFLFMFLFCFLLYFLFLFSNDLFCRTIEIMLGKINFCTMVNLNKFYFNYSFPIDLTPNGITFGAQPMGKIYLKSKLLFDLMNCT